MRFCARQIVNGQVRQQIEFDAHDLAAAQIAANQPLEDAATKANLIGGAVMTGTWVEVTTARKDVSDD